MFRSSGATVNGTAPAINISPLRGGEPVASGVDDSIRSLLKFVDTFVLTSSTGNQVNDKLKSLRPLFRVTTPLITDAPHRSDSRAVGVTQRLAQTDNHVIDRPLIQELVFSV
jgi:hypothetical protein